MSTPLGMKGWPLDRVIEELHGLVDELEEEIRNQIGQAFIEAIAKRIAALASDIASNHNEFPK